MASEPPISFTYVGAQPAARDGTGVQVTAMYAWSYDEPDLGKEYFLFVHTGGGQKLYHPIEIAQPTGVAVWRAPQQPGEGAIPGPFTVALVAYSPTVQQDSAGSEYELLTAFAVAKEARSRRSHATPTSFTEVDQIPSP